MGDLVMLMVFKLRIDIANMCRPPHRVATSVFGDPNILDPDPVRNAQVTPRPSPSSLSLDDYSLSISLLLLDYSLSISLLLLDYSLSISLLLLIFVSIFDCPSIYLSLLSSFPCSAHYTHPFKSISTLFPVVGHSLFVHDTCNVL